MACRKRDAPCDWPSRCCWPPPYNSIAIFPLDSLRVFAGLNYRLYKAFSGPKTIRDMTKDMLEASKNKDTGELAQAMNRVRKTADPICFASQAMDEWNKSEELLYGERKDSKCMFASFHQQGTYLHIASRMLSIHWLVPTAHCPAAPFHVTDTHVGPYRAGMPPQQLYEYIMHALHFLAPLPASPPPT